MRKRSFEQRRHAIAANYRLPLDVDNWIGAKARGKLDQPAGEFVRRVAKIERAARRRDPPLHNWIGDGAIQAQRNRRHYVAEIVVHYQGIPAFHVQLVEICRLRKLKLAAFFNRRLWAAIDQLFELDVLVVFGTTHIDVAGDELAVKVSAQVEVGIDSRTKILRIIQRHIGAVNVQYEAAAGRPGDDRAA